MKAADDFDLAVVGGGIVGATAIYLARRKWPAWRLLLLDRSLVGEGATAYSAGLAFPYGRTPEQTRLAAESARILAEMKAAVPSLPVYELPFYGLASAQRIEQVLAGFVTDSVHLADTAERESLLSFHPGLSILEGQSVLVGRGAGYAFPRLFVHTLIEYLRASDLTECWEGVEVQNISHEADVFTLRAADERVIKTKRVLIATGPWLLSGPYGDYARGRGVRIKKVAALHVDRPPRPQDPIIFFFDDDAFLLPLFRQRRWVFSFTSQEWDCPPEISRLKISADDRTQALSILSRYYPSFTYDCHGGRVFCDAYSPNRVPLVAQIPETPGCVVAGACSGSGYRLAPGVADAALEHFS